MDREGIHPGIIGAVILAVAGLGGLLYWAFGSDRTPEPPAKLATPASPPPPVSTPEPAVEPPPPLVLPALDESDPLIRELVGRLSAHPKLVGWLVGEDLARVVVTAVDNIARGDTPRQQLGEIAPDLALEGTFEVEAEGGTMRIGAESYRRYDLAVEVFDSLDTEGMAVLFQQLAPLFEEAYRDLGYPEGSFREQLAAAIALLRATPIVENPAIRLDVTNYVFVDPALEALGPAQKHLLRMGADHTATIQGKLERLAIAAGLAER